MRVTAETKTATRQRILEAARKLFAADGFESATTRDLARQAQIATGTLFNYFPTKEDVVLALVTEAYEQATEQYEASIQQRPNEPQTLEEDLFGHVAVVLRKLKPLRKYLRPILETVLSPLSEIESARSLRTTHLETVSQILARHGKAAESAVVLQLYWTLYIGVLAFWSQDKSPRQEDTLALLDQSLAMFVGWLATQSPDQRSGCEPAGASLAPSMQNNTNPSPGKG